MKSRLTHTLSQVVLTSMVTIAVSVGCSTSRSATSPAQPSYSATLNQTSPIQVTSPAQGNPACTLKLSEAPVVKGLRLGMIPDQVLELFSGSKTDQEVMRSLSIPPTRFGVVTFEINPDRYQNEDEFAGVSHISFTVLDGQVSSFTINHKGPQWPHVDNFIIKSIEGTTLPGTDQWEPYVGMEDQLKTLTCAGFAVKAFASRPGLDLNYLVFQNLEAEKILRERKRKAREQPSPTPAQ